MYTHGTGKIEKKISYLKMANNKASDFLQLLTESEKPNFMQRGCKQAGHALKKHCVDIVSTKDPMSKQLPEKDSDVCCCAVARPHTRLRRKNPTNACHHRSKHTSGWRENTQNKTKQAARSQPVPSQPQHLLPTAAVCPGFPICCAIQSLLPSLLALGALVKASHRFVGRTELHHQEKRLLVVAEWTRRLR